MGNVYAYRGRLTPALIVLALVAVVIVALGMVAGPAKATVGQLHALQQLPQLLDG